MNQRYSLQRSSTLFENSSDDDLKAISKIFAKKDKKYKSKNNTMNLKDIIRGLFKKDSVLTVPKTRGDKFEIDMEDAISKLDAGRIKSGRDEMLIVFRDYPKPICRVWSAYNLGSIYWAQIGDGDKAREYYSLVVNEAEKYGIIEVDKMFPHMTANACENMMHLSLSYEEFFYWVDKMQILQPSDNVLHSLPPLIKEGQQKGLLWSEILYSIASWSYNRNDPGSDRGEYARAVSTYHLMLVHRKNLRYSREIWGHVIYEFGTLAMRISNDAEIKMANSHQPEIPDEFTFLVKDAVPFVEEYLLQNPSNINVQKLLKNMNGFINVSNNIEKSKIFEELDVKGNEFLYRKDFKTAYKIFKEAEEISRSIGDENLIQICLGNLARIAMFEGNYTRALELTTEKEAICRNNNFYISLANALANKAQTLNYLNNKGDAIKCSEESSQLCAQHGFHELLQNWKPLFDNLKLYGKVVCCYKCDKTMAIVKGPMRRDYYLTQTQSGFMCKECENITCYNCSDNRIPCKCGAKKWIEIMFYK